MSPHPFWHLYRNHIHNPQETGSANATGPVLPMALKSPITKREINAETAKATAIKKDSKKVTVKATETAAETVPAFTGKISF